jgi:hypothetical protein
MENRINYCIVVPAETDLYAKEFSDEWYELYNLLRNIIREKLYSHRQDDICSVQLYRENENLIFAYKVVPVTAASMSAYSHYHALIVKDSQIVKGE